MIDPLSIRPGESAHETFYSKVKKCDLVEYNYRDESGELHTCVCKTLADCKTKINKIITYKKFLNGDKK